MIQIKFILLLYISSYKYRLLFQDIPPYNIKNGKNIEIFILDAAFIASGHITFIDWEGTIKFSELHREIDRYIETVPNTDGPYAPRVDEVVLVEYEGTWCRGSCLELVGDGNPSVNFIDYGNTAIVNISNIRRMPVNLSVYERFGNICPIKGLFDVYLNDFVMKFCVHLFIMRSFLEYSQKLPDQWNMHSSKLPLQTKIVADEIWSTEDEDGRFVTIVSLESLLE